MINNYKILTLSYQDATLDRLPMYMVSSENSEEEKEKLTKIKTLLGVQELFYLNTCNRVLYLVYTPHSTNLLMNKVKKLVSHASSDNSDVQTQIVPKIYQGEKAVQHLFEVASSLDSMIVGEREIIRQVKEAYEKSHQYGLTDDNIRILFQSCIQSAKSVYNQTRIGEKAVSVVALAMKKLRRFGLNANDEVILIGAGQSIKKACHFLAEWGVEKITIFNRTTFNAHRLLEICPTAEIFPLEEMVNRDLDADFIISCTGSSGYVLTPEIVHLSTNGKGLHKTKGILDLAVPADIHPGVLENRPIRLIEVESLREVADKNIGFRRKEIDKARDILQFQITDFKEKIHRRFIEKAFLDIPSLMHQAKDKAINEVFRQRMEGLDPEARELIEEMMEYMTKKCISIPMKTAREKYSVIRKSLS
ncbi:glutamyl-tRNA reductase [Membranihabitans maritimus]|uniref:glutamyl-tRNA reductase n=1 Tax=Membranihabitans maritimus TaxID=2904244 RepID=UPI001F01A858|nr:glutamyl-tRNA reductase [Membranihabitans maritimus]